MGEGSDDCGLENMKTITTSRKTLFLVSEDISFEIPTITLPGLGADLRLRVKGNHILTGSTMRRNHMSAS